MLDLLGGRACRSRSLYSLAGFSRRIHSLDSLGGFSRWIRESEFHTGPCRRMLSLLTTHFSLVANFKCILCMLSLDVPSFSV